MLYGIKPVVIALVVQALWNLGRTAVRTGFLFALNTATFIGYVLGGGAGAAVATIAVFLPAFVLVAVSGPLIPRLRTSRVAAAALDGVNAGAVALMAAVNWQLGRAALVDVPTVLIALAGAVLLFRFRVNSAWLVLAGGALGFVLGR